MNSSVKHISKFVAQRGLNQAIIQELSAQKNEPEWMLHFRLKALEIFEKKNSAKLGARSF